MDAHCGGSQWSRGTGRSHHRTMDAHRGGSQRSRRTGRSHHGTMDAHCGGSQWSRGTGRSHHRTMDAHRGGSQRSRRTGRSHHRTMDAHCGGSQWSRGTGRSHHGTIDAHCGGSQWSRGVQPPCPQILRYAQDDTTGPPEILPREDVHHISRPLLYDRRSTPLGKENPIVKTKLGYALLFVCLLGGSSASLLARGFSGNCSGTYLMDEAGGATSLWTLEADGTFFATSSLQALLKFSDQQGSWKKHGNNGGRGPRPRVRTRTTSCSTSAVWTSPCTRWAEDATTSPARWRCASSPAVKIRSIPAPIPEIPSPPTPSPAAA